MSAFRYVVWKNDKRTSEDQPVANGHIQLPIDVIREIALAKKEGELQQYIEKDERNGNAEFIKLKVSLWKCEKLSERSPFLSGEINTWAEQKAMYAAADAKKAGASKADDDFGIEF